MKIGKLILNEDDILREKAEAQLILKDVCQYFDNLHGDRIKPMNMAYLVFCAEDMCLRVHGHSITQFDMIQYGSKFFCNEVFTLYSNPRGYSKNRELDSLSEATCEILNLTYELFKDEPIFSVFKDDKSVPISWIEYVKKSLDNYPTTMDNFYIEYSEKMSK